MLTGEDGCRCSRACVEGAREGAQEDAQACPAVLPARHRVNLYHGACFLVFGDHKGLVKEGAPAAAYEVGDGCVLITSRLLPWGASIDSCKQPNAIQ